MQPALPTTTNPDVERGRPALWHFLLLYALVAVWIDFGHIHERHHSDSILFTLSSQYLLKPFFWEQDRVGMLIPALASLCPDLISALLLQTGLTIFLGLSAPLLLAEVVCPRPASRVAATLANATVLAFAPDRIRDILFFECCYPIAIALGCAGMLVLIRGGNRPSWWRYPAAAGLFVLAHWVYAGVSVWLLPLAASLAVIQPGVPAAGPKDALLQVFRFVPGWASLVLIALSFAAGLWFMEMAREANPLVQPTPQESLPMEVWPESWLGFFEALNRLPQLMLWPKVAGGLAALGLLAGVVTATVRRSWPPYPFLAALLVLGLAGATEFLFIGTRMWPAENRREPRYIIGFLESAQLMLGLIAVFPLAGWIAGRGRWITFAAMTFAMLAAASYTYGFPAPGNPRADLDTKFGQLTPDLLTADVDAIGGEYWTVWPAVLHANMTGPPRQRPFIGITLRSGEFRAYWLETYPQAIRVAVKATDAERNGLFSAAHFYGLTTPVLVGSHRGLEIYTTQPIKEWTKPQE